MEWIEANITGIAALIAAAYTLYRVLKMTSHEVDETDSSAVKQFAEGARLASERAETMLRRLIELEGRVDKLAEENKLLRRDNQEYLETLTNWAEGITLLLMQIKANQLTAAWVPRPEEVEKFSKKKNK